MEFTHSSGTMLKCDRSDYVGVYLRIYLHSFHPPPLTQTKDDLNRSALGLGFVQVNEDVWSFYGTLVSSVLSCVLITGPADEIRKWAESFYFILFYRLATHKCQR